MVFEPTQMILKYIEKYITYFMYLFKTLKIGIKFKRIHMWGNGL